MTDNLPPPRQPSELRTYGRYIQALFSPGKRVPVFDIGQKEAQPIGSWSDDEKKLLVEEGRRQLDRQAADLNQIQTRAQVVLTTGIVVGAAWASVLSAITRTSPPWEVMTWILWIVSAFFLVLATLGAASIMSARAEMGTINAALLTYSEPPVLDALASAYSRTIRTGHATVATRLTLLRLSVLFLLAAAVFLGTTWLSTRPGSGHATKPASPSNSAPASAHPAAGPSQSASSSPPSPQLSSS